MKKPVLAALLCFLSLSVVIISCSKNNDDPADDNYDTEASVQSEDHSNFSTQMDAVNNEVNIIMESSGGFSGRPSDVIPGVCNASFILDTMSNPRTVTLTYNGNNCAGTHSRTGNIVISMPANVRWKDAGATLTLTYTNLVITRLADNKSITINGSHTLTNVSGGLLVNLPVLNSITHAINSNNMSVRFDDNTQRTWQVARRRVFTYNNGIVVTVTGTRTEGNSTNIAEWGTNRLGRTFTTAITQPLVFRQDCSFRLVSGQVTHTLPAFSATGTFGLDAAGNATTCPGAGAYYCKVIWQGPNTSHSIIFPY